MPNATTKAVAHGVTGIVAMLDICGIMTNNTLFYPLSVPASATNNEARLSADLTNIIVDTRVNWSAYSATVTITYTK